jgi:hypothetical protein
MGEGEGDRVKGPRYIHGESSNGSQKQATPEYVVWMKMFDRCRNPRVHNYHRYGGRGITVCERWSNYPAFLEDMGRRPSNLHRIERINNDGHYTPENCRWATRSEQARNRRSNHRLTFNGRTLTMIEWSEELGLPLFTLCRRIYQGWSVERALTEPIHYNPRWHHRLQA